MCLGSADATFGSSIMELFKYPSSSLFVVVGPAGRTPGRRHFYSVRRIIIL